MIYNLTGRIDTANAPKVDKLIQEAISKASEPVTSLTFDCSTLDYISSTGLRIVLKYKKQYPDLEVINVSNDVYSVFEMTGFARIMNVKRALRKIDLSACSLIGEGGNGAAYRINDEEIVKVSKHSHGEEGLIRESEQVREAFLMGVPTVISFDIVDCSNGCKGIVMEALDSQSLGAYLAENPSRIDDIAPKYVELFRQANAVEVTSPLFRSTKEWLREHIMLPQRFINDEETTLLASLLDEIPDSNHFVHFDGHVGNVLMHGPKDDRNLMLIDFGDTGTGHPVLEIAGWAFMMLEPEYARGVTISEKVTSMSRELNREFARKVISEMFHTTDAAELDELVYKASLIGRIKSASLAQFWYSAIEYDAFKAYLKRMVEETITLVPEIKAAIREFVAKLN